MSPDIDQVDLGTRTVFIGDAVHSEVMRSGRPLTYQLPPEVEREIPVQRPHVLDDQVNPGGSFAG